MRADSRNAGPHQAGKGLRALLVTLLALLLACTGCSHTEVTTVTDDIFMITVNKRYPPIDSEKHELSLLLLAGQTAWQQGYEWFVFVRGFEQVKPLVEPRRGRPLREVTDAYIARVMERKTVGMADMSDWVVIQGFHHPPPGYEHVLDARRLARMALVQAPSRRAKD